MKTAEQWQAEWLTIAHATLRDMGLHSSIDPIQEASIDFYKQIQSDAIEKCAEAVHNSGNSLRGAHMHSGELCSILKREILSLIPQKEKKA